MENWLSVLIPVYNVENFLKQCLDSVAPQITDGVEVIALDDNSSDSSFQQLEDYIYKNGLRIKVLQHNKNRGLSAARNTLMTEASGRYIWFVDSDDEIEAGAVKKIYNIIHSKAPDIILFDYSIIGEDGEIPKCTKRNYKANQHMVTFHGKPHSLCHDNELLFSGLYKKGRMQSWCKIFKSEIWSKEVQFPEGKYFEDMTTTPRLAAHAASFYYFPEPLIKYRKRSTSIVKNFDEKKIYDMVSGLSGILDFWHKKHPPLSSSSKALFTIYAIKIYGFAIKEAKKQNLKHVIDWENITTIFMESIPFNKRQLAFHAIKNGYVSKLAKIAPKIK